MPILEMVVLIKVGGVIGVFPTVGLVFLTAVVGVAMLRRQGLSTILRAQQKMHSGELPLSEMVEGIFLAVGGALLLTPGFVTDALGFCCLIPFTRQFVIGMGMKVFKPYVVAKQMKTPSQHHETIDGEFKREE